MNDREDVQLSSGRSSDGAPTPPEVADLYAAASAGPPLTEPRSVADSYAGLYGYVVGRDDVAWAACRSQGVLVGFAHGHRWRWRDQVDDWSAELFARLGPTAPLLDDSFAVYLLAVSPTVQRQGLGRRLLSELLTTAGTRRAWLQTRDEETPARALYRSQGWADLGHGPDAPDGRPGRVMGLGLTRADAARPGGTTRGRSAGSTSPGPRSG